MHHGRARGFLIAQRLALLRCPGLLAQGLALRFRLLGHSAERSLECRLLLLDMGASRDPMEVMLQGFRSADLARNLAIALRLACLTPQLLQLRGELANQIGKAREI